jgi:GMP synthase PP-ATPase subunit
MFIEIQEVKICQDVPMSAWRVGLRAVTSTDGMTADFYPFEMS